MKPNAILALSSDYGCDSYANKIIARWAIHLGNTLEIPVLTDPYIPFNAWAIKCPHRIIGGHKNEHPSIIDCLQSALFLYNHLEAREIKEVLIITSSEISSQILRFVREIFKETEITFYCLIAQDGNDWEEWRKEIIS